MPVPVLVRARVGATGRARWRGWQALVRRQLEVARQARGRAEPRVRRMVLVAEAGPGPAREGPAREGPAREGPAREGPAREPQVRGQERRVLAPSREAAGLALVPAFAGERPERPRLLEPPLLEPPHSPAHPAPPTAPGPQTNSAPTRVAISAASGQLARRGWLGVVVSTPWSRRPASRRRSDVAFLRASRLRSNGRSSIRGRRGRARCLSVRRRTRRRARE